MIEEIKSNPEIIEFDVHLVNESTKVVKADKTVIKLYNNYLTYLANYIIEEEFRLEKIDDDDDKDPLLKKLIEGETIEIKKLKVEDEGLIPLDKICISRVTENQLKSPGEGTKLIYKIVLEYGDEFSTVIFCIKNRKEQVEIYNKLINWQISKNKWN